VLQRESIGPVQIVESGLDAVRRRLWLRETIIGTAGAALVAGTLYAITSRGLSAAAATLASLTAGAVAGLLWVVVRARRRDRVKAARILEAARPASRNLIVTAEELLRHPERARPPVRSAVFRRTAVVIGSNPAEAVSIRRELVAAVAAIVLSVAVAFGLPQKAAMSIGETLRQASTGSGSKGTLALRAVITPPQYTGQPPVAFDNPERVEALQGSRLRLTMRPGSSGLGNWRVRFGAKPLALDGSASEPSFEMTLAESGYIAIGSDDPAVADSRRLLPIVVSPDRAPTITIETPGKDLLLPSAKTTVAVAGVAADDYGLEALDLRYTKVSGSGEQFEFNEGSIPLTVSRDSARSWKARADIALPTLALAPGDALIYRFVGRDRRPGDAGLASSDTFFIEVAGPGQVALPGFEMPPDRERYALSQQMIVLKLHRLKARDSSIDRIALEEEMATIAAEQRTVRANFLFLTGGHVEDEEQEAEHSHEIQEGRLENTARREIVAAIQHMGRAEQGMARVNVDAALPPAQAAVDALQRAFGRNRYFLRTLPVRSRVDPSRRMTGELSAATDWRRELVMDPARHDARSVLARLLELSSGIQSGTVSPGALTALAEQAIAIDPSAAVWQSASRELLALRDGRDPTPADRTQRLNDLTAALAAEAMRGAAAVAADERSQNGLRNAWQEEKRRR